MKLARQVRPMPFTRGVPEEMQYCVAGFRSLLKERYVVGLQEEFETSVKVFAKRHGWANVSFPRKRRTRGKPKTSEISQETRERILEHNRVDMRLWKEAGVELAKTAALLGIDSPS